MSDAVMMQVPADVAEYMDDAAASMGVPRDTVLRAMVALVEAAQEEDEHALVFAVEEAQEEWG